MKIYIPMLQYDEDETGDLSQVMGSFYDYFYEKSFLIETDYSASEHVGDLLMRAVEDI